jgi:hypothetical protein
MTQLHHNYTLSYTLDHPNLPCFSSLHPTIYLVFPPLWSGGNAVVWLR